MKKEIMLERNLSALSVRYPQLALKIKNMVPSGNYKLSSTPSGYANLLVKDDSSFLSFYNPENPISHTQQYMDSLQMKFAPIVFFLGMGLGYHLNYFMRSISQKLDTKNIIIYEKDIEIFYLALSNGDYTAIINHPHIHFFIGDEVDGSHILLRTKIFVDDIYDLRSVKIIPFPPSIKIHRDYYNNALDKVKKSARQIMIFVGNDSFDALVGMENMMLNLKHILSNPGIIECKDKFKGKPGILVAAGPSLNKNMHLLKNMRDNAVVFACDTSLIPLMKKGIRPHFTSSLERTPGTELYYAGLNDLEGVYYLAMAVLMPETIESFNGRKFVAYRTYPHYDWLENDKGQIPCGMSVANLVFRTLEYLGCDPIILVGQDLAYAQSGETHVKGNVYGEHAPNILASPVIELEGNDGKLIKSERSWEIMKLTYEEDIARYQGTCINATEGGAKIRGAKVMNLQEAINKYCTVPFYPQAVFDDVYDKFQGMVNVQSEMERINRKCKYTNELLEKVIEDFDAAIKEAVIIENEIIEPFTKGENISDDDFSRLLSIEKKYIEMCERVYCRKDIFEINLQTIQAYDIWMASELSFLKDIYTDKNILSMARVRKMTEWLRVVGSLLIFTRNILANTEKTTALEAGLC
ncbi:MAG: motility associated factor glycosyltransferase family protein [Smithellaceae bacterium]